MYKYPYGDSQQLNLDWIISKIKELEAGGSGGAADLEAVANALVTLSFNLNTQYRRYDYCFLNGKLYRCLSDTSGVFDPSAWQEALIGDDLAVLTRWINAIDAAAVVDVKFDTSGTNGKLQQKYHDEYHDVVEVDYTPVQNSKRPLSSNAGYELNGAISDVQKQITAHVQTSTTASRAYKKGEYLVLNGVLYRVTSNISNGGTITIGTNVVSTTIENESVYKAGDTVSLDNSSYGQFSGCFTNLNRLRVLVPLCKPIIATSVSLTGTGTVTYRVGNGNYITFSLSDTDSVTILITFCGVVIQFDFPSNQVSTNNLPAAVQINNGLQLNFS